MYIDEKYPEQRTFSMALYMIAGTSAVLQLFSSTIILGLILLVLSFLMAKMQRVTARETTYSSHVEWTYNTLSTGTFVLFPISACIAIYFIFKNTDIAGVKDAMNSDDMDVLFTGAQNYISRATPYAKNISMITLTPPVLWWVRRCVAGFLRAKNSEPVDYPNALI